MCQNFLDYIIVRLRFEFVFENPTSCNYANLTNFKITTRNPVFLPISSKFLKNPLAWQRQLIKKVKDWLVMMTPAVSLDSAWVKTRDAWLVI